MVAFDLTLSDRALTGTRIYARELFAALQRRSAAVCGWERRLAPGQSAAHRAGRAMRIAAWLALGVRRRAAREGVAAYHSPCALGPLGAGCPVILTVHDATPVTMAGIYGPGWRLWHRVFGVAAVRRARAVIVPSAAARVDVAGAYGIPLDRVWVTPEGVGPEFGPMPPARVEEVLARYGLAPPYVLFVGAQGPRKNLLRLLDAYGQVHRAGLARQLVLVGPTGPTTPILRRRAGELGLGSALVMLDWVPGTVLPAVYAGAACLAYPSLTEGFGLPILEAQACGAAVVTSNRSAMPETAGDAALLVDPESVSSIADGLRRVLGEPALREHLASRGAARARAFTWERTATATETVYEAVIRAAPPRGPGAPGTREVTGRASTR